MLQLRDDSLTTAGLKFDFRFGDDTFRRKTSPPGIESTANELDHFLESPLPDDRNNVDTQMVPDFFNTFALKPPVADLYIKENKTLVLSIQGTDFWILGP